MLKIRLRLISCAVVAMAFAESTAGADPVTFNFTARITQTYVSGDITAIPDMFAGITAGVTEVSGSFTYELEQAGTQIVNENRNFGQYVLQNFSLALPSVQFSLPGQPWQVSVRNDVTGGQTGLQDAFVVGGSTDFDQQLQRQSFFIGLAWADVGLFTSTALPTTLAVDDFALNNFSFGIDDFGVFPSLTGTGYLHGHLTSLSVARSVPEPSSMALLGIGLAGVALRRWREKRR